MTDEMVMHHHRKRVAGEESIENPVLVVGVFRQSGRILVEVKAAETMVLRDLLSGADHVHSRMESDLFHHQLEAVREHPVIRIKEIDVLTNGFANPSVTGFAHALVRRMDNSDSAILRGVSVADFTCSIEASIVNDDDLEVLVCLG